MTKNSKLVLVTDVPFWNGFRGSHARIDSLIKYLAAHFELSIYFVGQLNLQQWSEAKKKIPFEINGPSEPGVFGAALAPIIAAFSSQTRKSNGFSSEPNHSQTKLNDYESEIIAKSFSAFLTRKQPHVILIEYVTLAWLCKHIPESMRPNLTVAIDTHDVMSNREIEFKKHQLDHWLSIDAAEEGAALSQADSVIAIQEEDCKMLTAMIDGAKSQSKHAGTHGNRKSTQVIVCKHPASIEKLQRSISRSDKNIAVGFLGSSGEANNLGICKFLEYAWPKIVETLGQTVELRIGGAVCNQLDSALVSSDKRITLVREVTSLIDFYETVDLVINPVGIHSGLKIKSLEALAFGLPLVTSRAGEAGLESGRDRCYLAVDDWNTFSDHVVRLAKSQEMRNQFSVEAHRLVIAEFQPETVYSELLRALTGVAK